MKSVDMTNMWEVQVSSGVLATMTLDQLDAAFQEGHITEQTLVREHGDETWSTLAIVAGIDSVPEPVPSMPNSMAPVVADVMSVADVANVANDPSHAAVSYIPQLKPMFLAAPKLDFDLDFDAAPAFKTSKKKMVLIGLGVAAAMVSVLGIAIASSGSGDGSEGGKAAAATPISAAVSLPPTPTPAAATTDSIGRLSDEQKRALLDADKKRIDPRKARVNEPAPPQRVAGKRVNTGNVFHKGGNQFDPLNSNL